LNIVIDTGLIVEVKLNNSCVFDYIEFMQCLFYQTRLYVWIVSRNGKPMDITLTLPRNRFACVDVGGKSLLTIFPCVLMTDTAEYSNQRKSDEGQDQASRRYNLIVVGKTILFSNCVIRSHNI